MARSQFSPERLRRPRIFLDRHAEIGSLGGHVGRIRLDPSRLAVVEVIGLGGVGKTSFLREAKAQLADKGQVSESVWVSLAADSDSSGSGPLLALRDQLDIECLLFDTALLIYWSRKGTPAQLDRSSRIARSVVFKSIERGGSIAAGFPLPFAFALEVYESLARQGARYRRYSKEDFETIQDVGFSSDQLRERLPHYLGLDIRRALDASGGSLVAFYDGYENQSPTTVAERAPWLRELIGTLDRGLHVLSTREPIGWDEDDWGGVMESLPLEELPDAEARELLRLRLGALSQTVEDRLIAVSKRIPFFLEALVENVEGRDGREGQIDVIDLPSSQEKVVDGLLEHLVPERRTIAIALAAVQIFDRELYEHLVRSLNLQATILEFDSFVAWRFVEGLARGRHKTHDLLTECVRSAPGQAEIRRASLAAATDQLLDRCRAVNAGTLDATLQLFRATIDGWRSVETMPHRSVETLIDCGYALNDAGYWNALGSLVVRDPSEGSAIAVVVKFFRALASRRTVGIERGLERFAALEPKMSALGRHQQSAALERAYLNELAGKYAKARPLFRELSEAALPFDPTDRTHVRARLYHADMLTMDGELEEASRILLEAYETVGHRAPLTWAELVRHRGHALRFAFLFEEAAQLYSQSLTAVQDAPAMQGKLHTNLVEACCWYDPQRALAAAELSTELNLRLGNQIELAKCQAAQAIAHAKLSEDDLARAAATRSVNHARSAGYPAGEAFALQARSVCEGLVDNRDGAVEAERDLARISDRLDTYAHLRVAPLRLTGDRASFEEVASRFGWIQPADLEQRLDASLCR